MPFDRATYWKDYHQKNRGRWTLKRTAINPKVKTEGAEKPTKKPVKINKVSAKQAKRLREYEKEKAISRGEVECCEFPGCESTDLTCHHSGGRVGKDLTDRKKFKWLCWFHHKFCEENPNEAKRLGLSINRLDKAS